MAEQRFDDRYNVVHSQVDSRPQDNEYLYPANQLPPPPMFVETESETYHDTSSNLESHKHRRRATNLPNNGYAMWTPPYVSNQGPSQNKPAQFDINATYRNRDTDAERDPRAGSYGMAQHTDYIQGERGGYVRKSADLIENERVFFDNRNAEYTTNVRFEDPIRHRDASRTAW